LLKQFDVEVPVGEDGKTDLEAAKHALLSEQQKAKQVALMNMLCNSSF